MSNEHQSVSRIGLDVGTSRIVLATRVREEFEFRSQLNAFVTIPCSRLAQDVLQKEKIPYMLQDGAIVVYGDESEKFADLFHAETRRPMLKGTLNGNEPEGLAVVKSIVSLLAGTGKRPNQKLCFSVPAPLLGSEEDAKAHEEPLRQGLSELGYEVRSIDEGLAVVYGELEETNYTGIGVSCGGGLCNVCLAYLSVPVISFSIPKAGDFIDGGAATAAGEVATRVRILKEQYLELNGTAHLNGRTALSAKLREALQLYYDDVIRSLVEAMNDAFTGQKVLPRVNRPLPLVLSGGSVLPAGFRDRFEQALRATQFPLPVSVRLARDPLRATARGALVAALADM